MHQLLQAVPIFAGLDQNALDLLLKQVEERHYPEETLILKEGDPGNRLFVIGSGGIRIIKDYGQPEAVELAKLGPGEFFGEMCILETLPRAASVQTTIKTTVFSISSMAFYTLYRQLPSQHSILLLNIARDLSRRLRRLDNQFAHRH